MTVHARQDQLVAEIAVRLRGAPLATVRSFLLWGSRAKPGVLPGGQFIDGLCMRHGGPVMEELLWFVSGCVVLAFAGALLRAFAIRGPPSCRASW